jgi:CRP-like cAMP-binding protein
MRKEKIARPTEAEIRRRVSVLERVVLFADWTAAERAEFAAHLEIERFEPQEVVMWEGDPGDTLYFISEGQVIVSRRLKGDVETIICRLQGGDFFGELDVIDDQSASANVQTETPCVFYTIGRLALYEKLEANPRLYSKFLLALLRELAKRLRSTNNKLIDAILWGIDATSLDTG